MSDLNRYREQIEGLDNECSAFKMDSTEAGKHMRKDVGLGGCHCCDYFISYNGTISLIELTDLSRTIEDIKFKYSYLKKEHFDEFVENYIIEENQLKVYASMLVLCRLAAQCTEAADIINGRYYNFWLVFSRIESPEDTRVLDRIKNILQMKKDTRAEPENYAMNYAVFSQKT